MRPITGLLVLALAGCSDDAQPPGAVAPAAASQAAASIPAPVPLEPAAIELVMDVMQVVGRSEAEVAAVLGAPASCEKVHRARWCKYPPHQDEVMFVAGKADMISVHGMGAVAFNQDALDALGLAPATPDHSSETAIRWESISGLEEVTVFAGPGNSIDYAYVKVGRH